LTQARRSSLFNFAFFHSFTELGRGEEGGDDYDRQASLAFSLWLLFFDTLVFNLFAEDAFILQVIGVFTHIFSGAAEGANYGDGH
jgi:hypothetical protein